MTDKATAKIPQPMIVDGSTECESSRVDMETTDETSFAFPDGNNFKANGGFDSTSQLKCVVHQLKESGHSFSLSSTATDNILRECESHTFEKSFPLQFPCGCGGRHDFHDEKKGKNKHCTLEQHLECLVDRAKPGFQLSQFLLVVCNVKLRERAMRHSGYHVNCNNWDHLFANDVCLLEPKELTRALENEVNGIRNCGTRADDLVRTLKSVCKSLPHTNDAARDARTSSHSMAMHFGQPTVFFAVSPNDSHNLRTQVYFNAPVDVLDDIDSLTDEDLAQRNVRRAEFRMRCPGCGSCDFENAVIEGVFGWNLEKGESHEHGGFIGRTIGFGGAVEEQGRKSLHVHWAIFLENWREMMELFGRHGTSTKVSEKLEEDLAKWFEKIGSTELIPTNYRHRCENAQCCDAQTRISKMIVDQQTLRELRHEDGCEKAKGAFAKCSACGKKCTPELLSHEHLKRKRHVKQNVDLSDLNVAHLEMKRMQMTVHQCVM